MYKIELRLEPTGFNSGSVSFNFGSVQQILRLVYVGLHLGSGWSICSSLRLYRRDFS